MMLSERLNNTFCVLYRMLSAEEAVLGRDGIVIRLAGLYTKERGAHSFWLRNGTVDAAADGCLNLLHYEDAAGAALAAIEKGMLNADQR